MAEGGEAKPEIVDESETMITKLPELKTFDVVTSTADESVNVEQLTTQFTDIAEVDVLAILRHLEAPDLINVAQTNRFLKKCAEATVLSCHESLVNHLVISSPNHRFFRQFGHFVRNLEVKCSEITTNDWLQKNLHILPVVADRCNQKNLQTLRLEQVCEDLSTLEKVDEEKVRKLFIRLKKLSIMDCFLNGWDELMKPAQANLEMLSLNFVKMDSWQEYVRRYQKLKTLYMSGFVSTEMLDLNPSIQSLNLYAERMSKNNLKSIGDLPNLTNATINITGPTHGHNVIVNDFRQLAEIDNLQYMCLMTAYKHPMRAKAYNETLLALQNHTKLRELYYFMQYDDPLKSIAATKLKDRAFPRLKQLGIFDDFPFISSVSKLHSIVDIIIMEIFAFHMENFEQFRSLIVSMPNLQRLIFDVYADINETCRESLMEMCRSRTSKSKLMVLVQNYENKIVQALWYPKTVLMFSVSQPDMPTNAFIFDESVVNAFDRARLLAQKGGYVAVNYTDFAKGINYIQMKQPSH